MPRIEEQRGFVMIYCREDRSAFGSRSLANVEIGARIRMRRKELGLSREHIAEEIGWFVAQMEDCENGLLRPPSRDLFLIADLLDVEIGYFYEGVERPVSHAAEPRGSSTPQNERAMEISAELHGHAGAIKLFCTYSRIRDTRKQALLLDLAESFAREA